jgi:hypothetical protein
MLASLVFIVWSEAHSNIVLIAPDLRQGFLDFPKAYECPSFSGHRPAVFLRDWFIRSADCPVLESTAVSSSPRISAVCDGAHVIPSLE